jgi:tRNA threonylcarbamoyladenosine modification (KEOPS) complex  Pcc1 subunit
VKESAEWLAVIRVRRPTRSDADRIAQALTPEASREVPRARAELGRPNPRSVEIRISAADTSACRAALNTYLAWVGLVLSTERAAAESVSSRNPPG